MIQQLSMKQLWYERHRCKDGELKEQLDKYSMAEEFMKENWSARQAASRFAINELKSQQNPCEDDQHGSRCNPDTTRFDNDGQNLPTSPCPPCSTWADHSRC